MGVTTNILQRTFRIRCDDSKCGTCFTIDVDNRRYLVTARHIAGSIIDRGEVEIMYNGNWLPLAVQLVGHGKSDMDVSVLAPQELFGATHPLSLTIANLKFAEDVYFLGFPFGISFDIGNLNANFPMPLVKKAIVSAIIMEEGLILLDGHNNPGFSGGPVVRCGTRQEQIVIGVVSGYRFERSAVLDEAGNEGPYSYDMNTGIVIVCYANQIQQLILDNPIGIKIK